MHLEGWQDWGHLLTPGPQPGSEDTATPYGTPTQSRNLLTLPWRLIYSPTSPKNFCERTITLEMRLNHFPTATHQQVGGQPPTTSTLQSHTPASQRPQDPTVTRHGATTAESIQNGPGEDSQGQPTVREGSWASRGSAGAEGKRCEGCSAQKTVTASGWIRPHVRCGRGFHTQLDEGPETP